MRALVGILSVTLMALAPQRAVGSLLCSELLSDPSRYDFEVREVSSAKEALERAWALISERLPSKASFLFRSISYERLNYLLEHGTDRDDSSALYNIPMADSSMGVREENGITPKMVTFLHMVTVERPMRTVTLQFPSVDFEAKVEQLDQIPGVCFAIAVYDPASLSRVSEVEYWFHKDPREALLAVYFKRCD